MTARPTPPAPPAEDDLFFRVLGGLFATLWAALRYWGRRTRQDVSVGLLYAVTWLLVLGLLVQNAHQALVLAGTPAYVRPAPQWPLAGRVFSLPELAVLLLLLLPALLYDRWRARRVAREAARPRPAPPLQFTRAEWVVGWVVARTWQPDPGAWLTERTGDLFRLTAEHLRVNLLVVAPQGAGKTSMVLTPILALCRRTGAAALVFDVKGDPTTPGERPDFDPAAFHVTFDFAHPERSAKLNLAGGGSPREIGEQLGEALIYDPGADKSYFVNNAKDALGSLFAAYALAYDRIPGFRDTLQLVRNKPDRANLSTRLEALAVADPTGAIADALLDLTRIDQLADGKTDVLGSLDLALAPLTRGAIADLLVTDAPGLRIADLLNGGARVRIVLPVARQPRVAPILGRLILAQFTNAVLDPTANRRILKLALVDEAHWFVTPSLPTGMAQARANFGGYVLALQDLAQIPDKDLREKIWGVATNRLVMAGVGDVDAEKFSRTWGAQERPYVTRSHTASAGSQTSRSQGRGQHSGGGAGGAMLGGGSSQRQTSRSATATESAGEQRQTRLRADWLPAEIHGLPPHHVVVERRDAAGHLTPPTLIALDRALTEPLLAQQDDQLRALLGHCNASRFRRPALLAPTLPGVAPGTGVPAPACGAGAAPAPPPSPLPLISSTPAGDTSPRRVAATGPATSAAPAAGSPARLVDSPACGPHPVGLPRRDDLAGAPTVDDPPAPPTGPTPAPPSPGPAAPGAAHPIPPTADAINPPGGDGGAPAAAAPPELLLPAAGAVPAPPTDLHSPPLPVPAPDTADEATLPPEADLIGEIATALALPRGEAATLVTGATAQGWTPAQLRALLTTLRATAPRRPAAAFRLHVQAAPTEGA